MTASQRTTVEKPTLAYSIAELAVATGVSESTIRDELRRKRLFAILAGGDENDPKRRGKQVVTPDEAKRWLESSPIFDPDA